MIALLICLHLAATTPPEPSTTSASTPVEQTTDEAAPRKRKKKRKKEEPPQATPAPSPKVDPFSAVEPPVAPATPAPWMKSPVIYGVQVLAGYGLRGLVTPCLAVPVVGPLVVLLLGPPLEAYAVTWTGDRLGDGRTALLAPLVSSMAVGGLGVAMLQVAELLGFAGAGLGAS
ncbi:MAG: hypothetical protein AB2A00_37570, partial [Myxococcota bacterium]